MKHLKLFNESNTNLIEEIYRNQYAEYIYILTAIEFDDNEIKQIKDIFPKFLVQRFYISEKVGFIHVLQFKYIEGNYNAFKIFKLPDEYFLVNLYVGSYFKIDGYEGLQAFCQKILAGDYEF